MRITWKMPAGPDVFRHIDIMLNIIQIAEKMLACPMCKIEQATFVKYDTDGKCICDFLQLRFLGMVVPVSDLELVPQSDAAPVRTHESFPEQGAAPVVGVECRTYDVGTRFSIPEGKFVGVNYPKNAVVVWDRYSRTSDGDVLSLRTECDTKAMGKEYEAGYYWYVPCSDLTLLPSEPIDATFDTPEAHVQYLKELVTYYKHRSEECSRINETVRAIVHYECATGEKP